MIRIGHGYDVHRFCEGEYLILGGIKIPYSKSFLAHSDGDVLIHALCDSLLGAASLGDIGRHFPDNDIRFKNIESTILLKETLKKITNEGLVINNIDITIIAEEPKISPFINEMQKKIALICSLDVLQINIKATTTEGLGFIGNKEGIAVHAVCLLSN